MTNSTIRASAGLCFIATVGLACGRQATVATPAPSASAPAPAAIEITDGESLIRAMHARYSGTWYRTLTFIQRTTLYSTSGAPSVQTWYEALSLPGRLRIDLGNPELGNGVLYRADSNYQMTNGKVTRSTTGFNELLVLGFDVYTQPPDVTISILRNLGYQLSRMRVQELGGSRAYVIGATSRTDTTSKQFWIERERLVFIRAMEKQASGRHSDIRFTDYVPAGKALVAKTVVQFVDGQRRLLEEYTNIKADPTLDPALFDPKQWATVKHWSKP